MGEHPASEVLTKFSRGQCTGAERQQVVRHLLAGCSSCGSVIRDLLTGVGSARSSQSLDTAWDRVFARVKLELPARNRGKALFSELAAMAPEHQLRTVESSPRFHDAALCRLLFPETEEALHGHPKQMLHNSRLATLIADRLQAGAGLAAADLADLRGEAWMHYANALRVASRLRDAERAFATAERHLRQGSGDLRLQARCLRKRSSLFSHQRRFQPAIAAVQQAAEIFHQLGEREELGRCLLKQAIFTGYAGEPEEALGLIAETRRLIRRDPVLTRQAIYAAAHFSIGAGKAEEGMVLLEENRELLENDAPPVALLRLTWLRGELARALGLYRVAESHLRRARQGFIEFAMPYEVALVCLELAKLYCETGLAKELQELAREMLPIFQSLRVRRETLVSLALLQHSETASALRLVGRIAAELLSRRPVHRFG